MNLIKKRLNLQGSIKVRIGYLKRLMSSGEEKTKRTEKETGEKKASFEYTIELDSFLSRKGVCGLSFDWSAFKQSIIKYAYIIGINKIGFTDAEPLLDYLPLLEKRHQAGYEFALQEGEPLKRVTPAMHLAEAKSIISVAVAYPALEWDVGNDAGEIERGRLSYISRGRDYHQVVRENLEELAAFIKAHAPEPAEMILLVDTGELLEKAVADKAGLGWVGRNTLLTTAEYGSYISLGEIISNLPFPPDTSDTVKAKGCGQCSKCLKACPTGALGEGGELDPDLCLAGLSQTKKEIPHHLRKHMGSAIYGCDICQQVCPYNKKKHKIDMASLENLQEELSYGFDEGYPQLDYLLKMNNRQFKEAYGHTSGAWRGRTVWQRNALIAAGNQRNEKLVPTIVDLLLKDSRTLIRGTAAWALGQISGSEALNALKRALETETENTVLEEIRYSLDGRRE